MDTNVFEIDGLECVYHQNGDKENKVVLQIDNLKIPMGKVTIILGQSGSGKSTLIETLGLMNNTIAKGSIVFHHGGGQVRITRGIWSRPSVLAPIRNRHFSFIFQNDFLMPYYSVEENMLIGRAIQDGRTDRTEETGKMRSLCENMGLNFEEISRKKPSELSVGQKQRLSFIRAIVKKYSVIFGDEPTGNLDEISSELLMDALCRSIRQDERLSAVLVSHHIPLSVRKADCILVLSRGADHGFVVRPGLVFSKAAEGWLNGAGERVTDDALADRIRAAVNMTGAN